MDASVVSRWYLRSQPFLEAVDRVRADYDAGRTIILAPENRLHEVTGAIHQAIFAGRLTAQHGIEQLDLLLHLPVVFVQVDELIRPAVELSLRYGCSYYDAIYLEIARRRSCHLIHADGNLRRDLNGRFALVLWIEDYLSFCEYSFSQGG